MRNWGDAKSFIFEDILVYALMIATSLSWDFFINLAIATGIHTAPEGHPYHFGTAQGLLITFAAVQLIRKANQWKYYS